MQTISFEGKLVMPVCHTGRPKTVVHSWYTSSLLN